MVMKSFGSIAELATAVATEIAQRANPELVLGVATGNTMLPIYQALAKFAPLEISAGFSLDEYVSLAPTDSRSFGFYVTEEIEKPLGLAPGTIRYPIGNTDPELEAKSFEEEIRANPIDLQILGVGRNGHIAFNEPGSDIDSVTRVVELDEQTRIDNGEDFDGLAPTHAITQGISTILRAKTILLIATGATKREPIAKLLAGEIDPEFPVTYLSQHQNLLVFVDAELAAGLNLEAVSSN